MKIIKRDGSEERFTKEKIKNSILEANASVSESSRITNHDIEYITNKVYDHFIKLNTQITVEDVQDEVENSLMTLTPCPTELAKHYITYRFQHQQFREGSTLDANILSIVELKNEVAKQENSNKNPVINSTQRDYIAGTVSRDITKRLLLPEDVMRAHEAGEIHVHDTDYFIQKLHNCDLISLDDMLKNGTMISGTKIETPHTFSTACTIATQVIAQVASNQYGGQSVDLSHLAPYVSASRKKFKSDIEALNLELSNKDKKKLLDSMVKSDITKGIQTLQYQIVTLMTTNGQAPFITLFMYLNEVYDKKLKKDLAIIIEEVLNQRIKGVKNEVGAWISPAFPKLIYVLEEDNIHEDSPYYYLTELAAKCTAKRLVPDYISEKKLMEYKYPKENLLTIIERKNNWGDESIWGNNPFKELSDTDCVKLQEKLDDKNYDYSKILKEYKKFGITDHDLRPVAYTCMGCLDYGTNIYVNNQKIKIGQLAESFNSLLMNKDKIQKFLDSDAEEIVL